MSNLIKVPFFDLTIQYQKLKTTIDSVIRDVVSNGNFILGDKVKNFEESFASYCGVKHCIGVNSGTSALMLSLKALGVGPGDEVITVPNTFVATAEAISWVGAKPVFVDVEVNSFNMNVNKLIENITEKTKAIIPVHLYGRPVDMDLINEVAVDKGMFVVEDTCQAHGALYKSLPVGGLSMVGCFSFFPSKNLGAYGEAGAIVTNNNELAYKVKLLRDHGSPQKYYHDIIGGNFRMEAIQGAVLGVKLKYLDLWNDSRRTTASIYRQMLSDEPGIILPQEVYYVKHVYHLFVICSKRRDELANFLKERGISTGIHYPIPIHLQKAFAFLKYERGSFPVAEKLSEEILSLPMFPEITIEQIEYVCENIKEFERR